MFYGDTNARIGCETGFIDNDNKYISTPHYTTCSQNSKARYSKDSIYNTRGKELIDICTASNLIVLNGRAFGDTFGNYTCFQYNGNSVVDYCIVSECLYDSVLYFKVHNHIPLLSDHANLTVKLYETFIKTKTKTKHIYYLT